MFNFWRKKDFQETKDLEIEIDAELWRAGLLGIGFFGIEAAVKGLSLLFKGDSKIDLKLFAGIVSETYRQIGELGKKIFKTPRTKMQIEFGEIILLTVPISDVVIFISVATSQRSLSHAADWIEKNRVRCSKIFSW